VLGRTPAAKPELLIYVMVDSVAVTADATLAHGGELVQPIGTDAPLITWKFRDPGGNVIGLCLRPGMLDAHPLSHRERKNRRRGNRGN
jgi:predicted enzyme related to lactoylglutathione lyase